MRLAPGHESGLEKPASAIARAFLSLEGLSVGDAFGQLVFRCSPRFDPDSLPAGPWVWTDDTHMALSIVEVLIEFGAIQQDALAAAFARRFSEQPWRGYGGGARHLLSGLAAGDDWRRISPSLFGKGSYGNGAAMRVAPLGAFFAGDPAEAARQADLSAAVTHHHPEGRAGSVAVAVAASLAPFRGELSAEAYLKSILNHVPDGQTRQGLERAIDIPPQQVVEAIRQLGTGRNVSAQDTVPFCLWVASHYAHDYTAAIRTAVFGKGDSDTTCAIVGGIVALSCPAIPQRLIESREPLPELPRS
jgi:ADP-ribosylglycohydrolase